MGIFAQVWFWSALAFLAGALLSWALLALPARRQLAQLDQSTSVERESRSRARPPVPPLPERPSRYDDDPLDRRRSSPFDEEPDDRRLPSPFDTDPLDRRRSSPFDEEPDERRVPSPFEAEPAPPVLAPADEDYDPFRSDDRESPRTELMSGVDTSADEDDEPADRGLLRLGGSSVSPPTVQVPVSGSLDEGSLFAPPEPPLPSRPTEDEAAATQFLPAIAAPEPVRQIEAPPEVAGPGDRGWFDETAGGSGGSGGGSAEDSSGDSSPSAKQDETLVDDLAVDPRRAESGELVDDVEDIEEPADTGGTIFTQRTQPVSGELISSLDGKAEESSSDTEPAEEEVEQDAPSSASHPTSVLPVRRPGANRFDTGSRSRPSPPKPEPKPEIEATQAIPAATATVSTAAEATQVVEPERSRSLFEPIVPADETVTAAMPAPGTAAATAASASGDGAFVPPGPFGPGSAMPLPGGGSPSSEFTVKASVTALRYCEPDSPLFGRTVAEVWFRTTKDAERVGFRPLS